MFRGSERYCDGSPWAKHVGTYKSTQTAGAQKSIHLLKQASLLFEQNPMYYTFVNGGTWPIIETSFQYLSYAHSNNTRHLRIVTKGFAWVNSSHIVLRMSKIIFFTHPFCSAISNPAPIRLSTPTSFPLYCSSGCREDRCQVALSGPTDVEFSFNTWQRRTHQRDEHRAGVRGQPAALSVLSIRLQAEWSRETVKHTGRL